MNPVTTIKEIETNLQAYIRRTLPVERSMPAEFTPQLNALFNSHRLAQDPYLELMPGYAPGDTLQDLVTDGTIYQETADIFAKAFLG